MFNVGLLDMFDAAYLWELVSRDVPSVGSSTPHLFVTRRQSLKSLACLRCNKLPVKSCQSHRSNTQPCCHDVERRHRKTLLQAISIFFLQLSYLGKLPPRVLLVSMTISSSRLLDTLLRQSAIHSCGTVLLRPSCRDTLVGHSG